MATTIDLGKIRLQWKGDYSNATSYELLDVVKFKGDSYVFISTIAAANKTPDTTSEWDLMVSGGDQWSTGTSVPTGGNPGDMYLKTDDEKVYTNTAGSWGVVGDMGGSRWTSGTSVPSGGEDGDFYLKTDDEKVYERVSGSWVVKLDIGGGVWTSSASNGSGGESGDWHVNTATKSIQENVGGTWTQRIDLSVSSVNIQDLNNVPPLSAGKFMTNDGTNTSWATVDVTGSSVGGDVSGTVGNIQISANTVTDIELNSTKLNGIESGATADQTNAEIKTAYEANVDTNVFSDAEQTKLAGIATSANNYSHPANHDISVITGLQSALDAKTTESYVDAQITSVVGAAPAALNTLQELGDALGDDANFAGSMTTALAGKVDAGQVLTNVPSGALFTDTNTTYSVGDGGLTEKNFTTADNAKLDGIESGATADQTLSEINALGITATSVDLGNWTITESGGVMYFATSGSNKMKIDASGNLTCVGNVTAYGAI
jgi:hypothetical protein